MQYLGYYVLFKWSKLSVPRQLSMLAMPLAHMHTLCYTVDYCIPYNCSITEHRAREEISYLS